MPGKTRDRVRIHKEIRTIKAASKPQVSWGLTGDGQGHVDAGNGYLYVRPEGIGPRVRVPDHIGLQPQEGVVIQLNIQQGRYAITGEMPATAPFFRAPPTIRSEGTCIGVIGATGARGPTGPQGPIGPPGDSDIEPFDAHLNNPVCCVYNSANIATINDTWKIVTFNSERIDTDNMHSIVANTSRITFNTAGTYVVSGMLRFGSNDTGPRGISILLNGTTDIVIDFRANAAWGADMVSTSRTYPFIVGDYIELRGIQKSGGALTIDAAGNYSPEFQAARIGG